MGVTVSCADGGRRRRRNRSPGSTPRTDPYTTSPCSIQNVVIMRHGDRLDSAQPMWAVRADRPWDTPLAEVGKVRAWVTGKRLRGLGFPIHRVVVSPFLRCLQTAAEVVRALCAVEDDDGLMMRETSDGVQIDPTRVKDLQTKRRINTGYENGHDMYILARDDMPRRFTLNMDYVRSYVDKQFILIWLLEKENGFHTIASLRLSCLQGP